jgi:hypothetical protein
MPLIALPSTMPAHDTQAHQARTPVSLCCCWCTLSVPTFTVAASVWGLPPPGSGSALSMCLTQDGYEVLRRPPGLHPYHQQQRVQQDAAGTQGDDEQRVGEHALQCSR